MKSLADALPTDIARQVHPDWRKNEAAYWGIRDRLLGQYMEQWIAFDDGAVIAAAATPLEVFLAVQQSAEHPFVTRVGHEDEPWYRVRRTRIIAETMDNSANCKVIADVELLDPRSTSALLERLEAFACAVREFVRALPVVTGALRRIDT